MLCRLHHGSCQQQIEYLRARTQAMTAALRPDRSIGAPAKAASLIGSPIQNGGYLRATGMTADYAAWRLVPMPLAGRERLPPVWPSEEVLATPPDLARISQQASPAAPARRPH